MSSTLGFYLIAIINSASIFGRLVPTYFADKLGRFNLNVVNVYITALLVLCIWTTTEGNIAAIIFAGFYGFTTGAFVGLAPALVAQISPIREIGMRNGIMFAVAGGGALAGNPIAGALITRQGGDYIGCQIFAGLSLLIGSVFFTAARWSVAGGKHRTKV